MTDLNVYILHEGKKVLSVITNRNICQTCVTKTLKINIKINLKHSVMCNLSFSSEETETLNPHRFNILVW